MLIVLTNSCKIKHNEQQSTYPINLVPDDGLSYVNN